MCRLFRHFQTTIVKRRHKNKISPVSDDGFTKKAETCNMIWKIKILSVTYNCGWWSNCWFVCSCIRKGRLTPRTDPVTSNRQERVNEKTSSWHYLGLAESKPHFTNVHARSTQPDKTKQKIMLYLQVNGNTHSANFICSLLSYCNSDVTAVCYLRAWTLSHSQRIC
jgi:hypothetical protein